LVSPVGTGCREDGSRDFGGTLNRAPFAEYSPAAEKGGLDYGRRGLSGLDDEARAEGGRPSGEREEVALLARVCARDKAAFEQLYRLYFRRLGRFLDRITRRADLVEEILNDVMLAVWHRADTFSHESRVSTWIFAIAWRQAMKRVQRGQLPEATAAEVAVVEGDESASPETLAILRQSASQLRAALERLPVEQRMTVELTYFHGYGYPEIARIMDCPTDTVKTRMFHARRKLRLMLEASHGR